MQIIFLGDNLHELSTPIFKWGVGGGGEKVFENVLSFFFVLPNMLSAKFKFYIIE